MTVIIQRQNEIEVYVNQGNQITIKETEGMWNDQVGDLIDAAVSIRAEHADLVIAAILECKKRILENGGSDVGSP